MILNLILIIFITLLNILFLNKSDKLNTQKKIFLMISLNLLFVIVASRKFNIGNDTMEYLRIFKGCSFYKLNSFNMFPSIESGYIFLNVIISFISNSSRFFIVCMSAIFYIFMYKFIKNNSSDYYFSIFLFITLLFFYHSMSMMRQILAIAITASGYEFIKNKKFMKYCMIVLLAMLFHKSAIIAILIYPLFNLKYTKKRALIMCILGAFCFVFLQNIFSVFSIFLGKQTSYLDNLNSFKTANIIYSLIYMVIYIFTRYILKNKYDKSKENSFYLYIILISFILNVLSIKLSIMSRLAMYFSIYVIIVIPNIISKNIKDYKLRFFVSGIICVLFALYSCIIIYNRPEWNSAFNYESCIMNNNKNNCN